MRAGIIRREVMRKRRESEGTAIFDLLIVFSLKQYWKEEGGFEEKEMKRGSVYKGD